MICSSEFCWFNCSINWTRNQMIWHEEQDDSSFIHRTCTRWLLFFIDQSSHVGRWEKWFPWTVVILSPPEAHFCTIRVLAQWNVSVWNFWHTLNAATWFICNKKVCVITSLKREVSKKSVSSSVWRRLVFQVGLHSTDIALSTQSCILVKTTL